MKFKLYSRRPLTSSLINLRKQKRSGARPGVGKLNEQYCNKNLIKLSRGSQIKIVLHSGICIIREG